MIESIVVNSGVPIPPLSRRTKYPFASMEVGDSFFVWIGSSETLARIANNRHAPKQFTQRSVTENGHRGVRVWRIA